MRGNLRVLGLRICKIMQSRAAILLLFLYAFGCVTNATISTNVWGVRISNASEVNSIAERNGFHNRGPVGTLNDVYKFELLNDNTNSNTITKNLTSEEYVLLAEQQYYVTRKIESQNYSSWRDLIPEISDNTVRVKQAMLQELTGCKISILNLDEEIQRNIDSYLIKTTDLMEAEALSQDSDILYSGGWRRHLNMVSEPGPGHFAQLALRQGVEEGRGGKGSIYVWASGSGAEDNDCVLDGYASSPYTISVAAISIDSPPPTFCSSTLVTAIGENAVAATLLVSGIISLTLEANHNLTWRDVQYLMVYTSNHAHLTSDTTGAGLNVSDQYGFGIIDAEAMVTRARYWSNVPNQINDTVIPEDYKNQSCFKVNFNYSGSIQYLEHVIVVISINARNATDYIDIGLQSPSGTRYTLLKKQLNQNEILVLTEWPFTSVKFWGENPWGNWILDVISENSCNINITKLQLFGVSTIPESVKNIPMRCPDDCWSERSWCADNSSSRFCDSCRNMRDAYTLECQDVCPDGKDTYSGYCLKKNLTVFLMDNDSDNDYHTVSGDDDFISEPIHIQENFTFGCDDITTLYVGSNGYISLGNKFTGFTPFEFTEGTGLSLVAPLFADINAEGGRIYYKEYHNESMNNSVVNGIEAHLEYHLNESYSTAWIFIATWENVLISSQDSDDMFTFQAILTTNSNTNISYAILTHKCNETETLPNGVNNIGYVTEDGLYENFSPLCAYCTNSLHYNIIYEVSRTDEYCNNRPVMCPTPIIFQTC